MKTAWQTVQLGDVCTFENGDRGENYAGRSAFVKAGIPIINAGHLTNTRIDTSEMNFITRERFNLLRAGKIRRGDVLFCLRGSLGKFALNDCYDEGAIASSLIIIRPKSMLDVRFLCAYLESSICADMVKRFENGAAQPNLGGKSLEKFLIPLPPLDEQRRIVAVLDEGFAAIAAAVAYAEKNLGNARDFRDCFLRRLYADIDVEAVPLGAIAEFRNGLNFTGASKGEVIKIVGVKDFQNNLNVPVESLATVQTDGVLAGIDVLKENDILTVRSNGNKALIGRCMIAGQQSQKTSHSGFTIRIRPTSQAVDPQFLCRVLKSPSVRETLVAGGGGANISNLNQKVLANVKVPLPCLAKQKEILAKQDKLESLARDLIAGINQKLLALTELKQSLLCRAFAGELAMAAPAVANDNWQIPAFTAHVIALAYCYHLGLGTEATFGRVKAQKVLHLCESVGGVELGRSPIKDAAGPNDFQHMLAAEDWAKAVHFFEFLPRPAGNGYSFKRLARFNAMVAEGADTLQPVKNRLDRAIGLIAPMNSEQAELFATVHAAWNNLILDGVEPTETAIIHEARENWHIAKQKFGEGKFRQAIATIRAKGIEPDGSAKRVGGQEAMLF